MTRPTICAECRHQYGKRMFFCMGSVLRYDYVTGYPIRPLCHIKNAEGRCADFAPKPLPWWRRLFGGRGSR